MAILRAATTTNTFTLTQSVEYLQEPDTYKNWQVREGKAFNKASKVALL